MANALKLEIEWLEAPGVRDVALARTWSRFALFANDVAMTQCSDEQGADAVRPSLYGSMLPLAEWTLAYWYHLLDGRRDEPKDPALWRNWRRRHAWRAGREGLAFPNLVTYRRSEEVVFSWQSDSKPILNVPVRFLQDGELQIDREQAERFLSDQLMMVLARRLDGTHDSRAQLFCDAWNQHLSELPSQRHYRQLLARLDVEEDEIPQTLRSLLHGLAKQGLNPIVDSLMDAADPECLAEDKEWADAIWKDCERAPLGQDSLQRLIETVKIPTVPLSLRPWEVGWKRAQALRAIQPRLRPNGNPPSRALRSFMSEVLAVPEPDIQRLRQIADGALDDVVAWAPKRKPTFVLARDRPEEARNFRLARDLHAVLFEGSLDQPFARVASGYLASSLAEAKAFATELLAPVDFIRQSLGSQRWISENVVEKLARELAVQPQIVRHQIENHHLAGVS